MENYTNKIMKLANGQKYFVIRQAAYKGEAYYFAVGVTDDGEDFTNEFKFLVGAKTKDGKFGVKEVKDKDILKLLASNIKIDNE